MAEINRFMKPAQQKFLNTYDALPYQEMLAAQRSKDLQQEKALAGSEVWGEMENQYLGADRDAAMAAKNELDRRLNEVSTGDLTTPEARAKYRAFEKDAKKLYGKEGVIGAAQAQYDSYQAMMARERARLAKGDISQEAFKKTTDKLLADYKGIGEGGPNGYNSIFLEDIAENVNIAETMDKYGKGIKADVFASASAKANGMYIDSFDQAIEIMGKDEVERIVSGYIQGDQKAMNFLTQSGKYGYAGMEQFMNALGATGEKYSYEKETKTAGKVVDSNAMYDKKRADDKQDEFDKVAATVLSGVGHIQSEEGDLKPRTYEDNVKEAADLNTKLGTLNDEAQYLAGNYAQYIGEDGNLNFDITDPAAIQGMSSAVLKDLRKYEDTKFQIGAAEGEQLNIVNRDIDLYANASGAETTGFIGAIDDILEGSADFADKTELEKANIKQLALQGSNTIIGMLNEASDNKLYNEYNGDYPNSPQIADWTNTVESAANKYYAETNKNSSTEQRIALDESTTKYFNLGIIGEDVMLGNNQYDFTDVHTGKKVEMDPTKWDKTEVTGILGGNSVEVTPMREIPIAKTVYGEDLEPVLDEDEQIKTINGKRMIVGAPLKVSSEGMELGRFIHDNVFKKTDGMENTNAITDLLALSDQKDLSAKIKKDVGSKGISDGNFTSGVYNIGKRSDGMYLQAESPAGSDYSFVYLTDSQGKNRQRQGTPIPNDELETTILNMSYKLKYASR